MSAQKIPGFTYLPNQKHRPFKKEIYTVAPNIYAFTSSMSSMFGVLIGTDGYILVDTGSSTLGAAKALEEIKKHTSKPLKAIILTHSHPDHIGGVEKFLEGQPGDVAIWGRSNFGAEQKGFRGLEKISALRGGRQFGAGIPEHLYTANTMLPQSGEQGKSEPMGKIIPPNHFLSEPELKLHIAGINLELHQAPGETSDHLFVWLPKEQILFCGDNMYRSFPNLYPIRGAGFRDIAAWAASVRRVMDFKPQAVVMGHGAPVMGAETMTMLENYSAAIQYVYDETVKGMNEGKTPDELAATIQLPEHLRGLEYLAEYYGCVPWAVRSIFSGLLGWFDGNPSKLVPLAPLEEAERMAHLAGGKDKLLAAAQKALQDKDYRWAAQLADYLLRLGEGSEVQIIKADALEALSKLILPISGINYLMASSIDLRRQAD